MLAKNDPNFQENSCANDKILDSNFVPIFPSPAPSEASLLLSTQSQTIKDGGIYFEYDLPEEPSDGYRRYEDDRSNDDWKIKRPSYVKSWGECIACSIYTTLLCGIPAGFIAVLLSWLDLNLAEVCYSYNKYWYQMPTKVRRVRLTAQVAEGMVIQFWSFTALLYAFGWKGVNDQNIPIWNVLAAALDAIYRLFLSVYGQYNREWASYPLNVVFAGITCFNYYRITANFERELMARIKLAVKFGIAFLLGTPLFLMMNYLLLPVYRRTNSDISKAIFSSFLPVAFIIPKAVINVCLVDVSGLCKPGRLSVFVLGFHTITSIITRYLQANVETTGIFIALCFVHAFENLIDKLTLNLRNKGYRYFCGSCVGKSDSQNDVRKARLNRIQADQSLSGMILETDTILMSCALVEILNYYYSKDPADSNMQKLLMRFLQRVSIAAFIEVVSNAICVKVQTYYFNIPVIRVWKKKWWWIFAIIITYTCYTMLYCSEYLYGAIITHHSFNSTEVAECLKPFEKPHS